MERLTQAEIEILTRMLTSNAYREKLAAVRYEAAVDLAITPQDRKYVLHVAEEEWEHYHKCLQVAKELDIDLEPLVNQRMTVEPPGIPPFNNWLDVLLAHTFADKAGYFILAALVNSKVSQYAEMAAEIAAEEERHGNHGASLLEEFYSRTECDEKAKHEMLMAHIDAGVRCLGQPNTRGDREAVALGLKTKPAAEIIRDFCAYADDILVRIRREDLIPLSSRYLTTTAVVAEAATFAVDSSAILNDTERRISSIK